MSRRLPISSVIHFLSGMCSRGTPRRTSSERSQSILDVFYADDLTYATTSDNHRTQIKNDVPPKLSAYNLHVNTTKTEEGEAPDRRPPPPPPPPPLVNPEDRIIWSDHDWLIPREMKPPEPSYKNIKLLGTKLDTKCDILSKKTKVWDPIKKFKDFFISKRLSIHHKIRLFSTYVEPILLYCTIVKHGS